MHCVEQGKKWRSYQSFTYCYSYRETGDSTFPYMICAFTPESGVPSGFTSAEIPAATWAVFTTKEYKIEDTSKFVQALWKRIYTEWFPSSGYEHGICGELEIYGVADNTKEYCEIWISVVKK
ncbi:MAG: effector binding domain-containing protein [Desulfosporosinus sp.]|nr:effector binding domain-containing protein [Desulfosporosinus sp.]